MKLIKTTLATPQLPPRLSYRSKDWMLPTLLFAVTLIALRCGVFHRSHHAIEFLLRKSLAKIC